MASAPTIKEAKASPGPYWTRGIFPSFVIRTDFQQQGVWVQPQLLLQPQLQLHPQLHPLLHPPPQPQPHPPPQLPPPQLLPQLFPPHPQQQKRMMMSTIHRQPLSFPLLKHIVSHLSLAPRPRSGSVRTLDLRYSMLPASAGSLAP